MQLESSCRGMSCRGDWVGSVWAIMHRDPVAHHVDGKGCSMEAWNVMLVWVLNSKPVPTKIPG